MSDDFKVDIVWQRDKNGAIISTSQANVLLALSEMGVKLSYDEFARRYLCQDGNGLPTLLDDARIARLWLRLDETFRWRPTKEFFSIIVLDQAYQKSFHPVRDYLNGLKWDGVKRLDNWLGTYGGVEKSEYSAAVGMLALVAAVRRVREPGCKFDEMLVLETSKQGTEKSSAIAALCPVEAWFSDDMPLNSDSKEVIERSSGHWIIEAAELSGMSRGDVEHLKAFLSRQVDKARLSYDKMTTERPRQFIMMGTTNSSAYLRDATGNRRFWPVKIGKFKIEDLRRDRDQLWAEAAMREATGQSIRLDEKLWDVAAEEQEARLLVDPWEEIIEVALGDQSGKVAAAEIWGLIGLGDKSLRADFHSKRIGAVMAKLGYERKKLNKGWSYVKGTEDEQKVTITLNV